MGKGSATPVAATAYDTLTQEAYKAGKIVVLSDELLKLGDPDAERTVRETVIAGVAAYLDAQFLTNTVTLSREPAAGGDYERRDGDHVDRHDGGANQRGPCRDARGDHDGWRRARVDHEADDRLQDCGDDRRDGGGGSAADVVRDPAVVLSSNSPAQITLVDAAHILYSDTGGFDVDISTQAAIQLDSAPTDPPVAATVIESPCSREICLACA